LALLKQSEGSSEILPGRLNLRGPLLAAGTYADIVHQHRSKSTLTLGVVLDGPPRIPTARIEFTFRSDEPKAPRVIRLRVIAKDAMSVEVHTGRGQGGPYELQIGDAIVGKEARGGFYIPPGRLLPVIYRRAEQRFAGAVQFDRARVQARSVLGYFQELLENTRAVGAFRHRPKRRYDQGAAHEAGEAAGERVINALIEDGQRRRRRGELLSAVNRWLKAVGKVRLLPLRRISMSAR